MFCQSAHQRFRSHHDRNVKPTFYFAQEGNFMLIGIQSLDLAFIASVKMLAIEKINGGYTSFSR